MIYKYTIRGLVRFNARQLMLDWERHLHNLQCRKHARQCEAMGLDTMFVRSLWPRLEVRVESES